MTASPDLRWIRPPHQARSQETLERILDAAEALIADKGYEDATVQEIVRRAGSSVGAFYTRFRDKDGLLYAIYERYLEQAIATADDALEPARWDGVAIPELVRSVVGFLVGVYRERSGLIRAFVLRNHMDAEFQARQERLSHYVHDKLVALLLARRDESVTAFLKDRRDRARTHFHDTDAWTHGYWRMSEAHHGTEHAELFLGFLHRLDPADDETRRHPQAGSAQHGRLPGHLVQPRSQFADLEVRGPRVIRPRRREQATEREQQPERAYHSGSDSISTAYCARAVS